MTASYVLPHHDCTAAHIDPYTTLNKFHLLSDMMKELAEKQFCNVCDVILVIEVFLDKQEESLYVIGIQS